jgi:hypothetical protein
VWHLIPVLQCANAQTASLATPILCGVTMRHRQQDAGSEMVLIALVVVACVAGIPPIAEVVVQAFAQSKGGAVLTCRSCGVVEGVREVTLGDAKDGVSTVSGEGLAMFVALLKGSVGSQPVKVYEVEVLLKDGSTRVIREATPPAWKPGDHVKVVMGQVRRVL